MALGPVEAAGTVDAQTAPTAPWKTLRVFHELPQGILSTKSSTDRFNHPQILLRSPNFNDERRWRGSTTNMKLVERITRVDADTLKYEFTVTDPETWTSSWTASISMRRTDVPMYEYACHEGNYAMPNILAGHRAEEKAAKP